MSYVKKSESKQIGVRHRGYEKLGHCSFQGSYSLNGFLQGTKEYRQIEKIYQGMFEENKNRGIFVVAVFEHEKEQLMKEYLLKPHKRLQILTNNGGEIFLLQGENGLRGISPLISDKYFVFIHFKYDTDTFLRAFVKENYSNSDRITNEDIYTFIEKSDIQISFGFRKSPLTSIHTILKSYGLE